MTRPPCLAFLFDLVQDVNILRPLVLLARAELEAELHLLVSSRFLERDAPGTWRAELEALAAEAGAALLVHESEFDALRPLFGRRGALVAASETDLSAHATNHRIFLAAPPGFLRITVQHGFECVGFLQNREHDRAHGINVGFAADVVCAWSEAPVLTAMPAAQRDKVYVSGPPALLQPVAPGPAAGPRPGMVCENLHSVRLSASGDFKAPFMDTFFAFCARLAAEGGEGVVLRPHPAGRFFEKNGIGVPGNVTVDGRPSYRVAFGAHGYGITAPSSVALDMMLAGVPVALWQDEQGVMDLGNYPGLTVISTLEEWLAFRRDARLRPEMLLDRQDAFFRWARMPMDGAEVRRRFLRLLAAGTGAALRAAPAVAASTQEEVPAPRHVAFIANGFIPTLQLSFIKPLAPLVEAGRMRLSVLTEEGWKERHGAEFRRAAGAKAAAEELLALRPDIVVFCRYSGPHAAELLAAARGAGIPTVFHLDDDLLAIPREIGEAKWRSHNQPARLGTVRTLLAGADLVYASNAALAARIGGYGLARRIRPGHIYCAGGVLNPARERPVTRIGYMGFDHAHDFALTIPALLRYLDANPGVTFELFGSIPKPAEFDRFGERFRVVPPVRDYADFLRFFASLEWDIGICPLAATPFNLVKANTKWVEYTSVGAAMIGSRGTVYDGCAADGCGLLVEGEEEWLAALQSLTDSPVERFRQVQRAQAKLEAEFSVERLREQVLRVFAEAAGAAS